MHDNKDRKLCTAIVLAAGLGVRASQGVPKQFLETDSIPILVHTIRAIEAAPSVNTMVCVVPEGWVDEVAEYGTKWGIHKLQRVVVGDRTWLESLWLGLRSLDTNEDDIILVHEGARPFVTPQIVEDNLLLARENPVVVTATPLVETLAQSVDGVSSSHVFPRDGLWRVQTPQTFRYSVLEETVASVADWEVEPEPTAFSLYIS